MADGEQELESKAETRIKYILDDGLELGYCCWGLGPLLASELDERKCDKRVAVIGNGDSKPNNA
jgi:hypothetical protein